MSGPVISLILVVVAFAAVVFWAYRPANKARFDEYAKVPLDSEHEQDASVIPADSGRRAS